MPSHAPPVVFVTCYYSPYVSGLTAHVRGLAEGLAARGHTVRVVTSRHEPSLPREDWIGGVHVERVRPALSFDKGLVLPGLVPRALRAAGRHGTIIPVLPLIEAPLLALGHPLRTLPLYICDLRLGDTRVAQGIERLAHASAKVSIRRAPAFLASSREYAGASRVVGSALTPVVESPPPIEVTRFAFSDPEPLVSRLGLRGTRRIGFVGRLVQEKGILVLIDAFRLLRDEFPDLRLVIAGEGHAVAGGGMHDVIQAAISPTDGVLLTGFLPDEELPAFYSMLDVLALPSIDPLEAYGMVQVEAMLCGTPVVASDMPGVRIPVQRSGMGGVAAPGNPAALAREIAKVLRARSTFVRGRGEIARLFSPEIPVDLLEAEILRRLLVRPGPG